MSWDPVTLFNLQDPTLGYKSCPAPVARRGGARCPCYIKPFNKTKLARHLDKLEELDPEDVTKQDLRMLVELTLCGRHSSSYDTIFRKWSKALMNETLSSKPAIPTRTISTEALRAVTELLKHQNQQHRLLLVNKEEELADVKRALERAQHQRLRETSSRQAAEKKIQDLEREITGFVDVTAKLEKAEKRCAKQSRARVLAEEEAEELRTKLQDKETDLMKTCVELTSKTDEAAAERKRLQSEISGLKDNLKSTCAKLVEAEKTASVREKHIQNELARMRRTVSSEHRVYLEMEAQNKKMKLQLREKAEEVVDLEAAIQTTNGRLQAALDYSDALEQQLDCSCERETTARAETQTLADLIKEQGEKLEDSRRANTKLSQQLDQSLSSEASIKEQMQLLRDELEQLREQLYSVSTIQTGALQTWSNIRASTIPRSAIGCCIGVRKDKNVKLEPCESETAQLVGRR